MPKGDNMARVGKVSAKPVRTKVKTPTTGVKTVIKYNKAGQVKSKTTDFTRRAMKSQKAKTKVMMNKHALELEKVKSNNAAKVAIAGETGATITSSVGTGIGYRSVDQQVNGGMSTQGGLGRDEANSNNSGNKDQT